MDHAILECIRREIEPALTNCCTGEVVPIPTNKWIASSAMQKSIRRGDVDTANRAAATLLIQDPRMLWRRLMVIAVEDVGLGDLVAATQVSAAVEDREWCRRHGDSRVAAYLIEHMARAPKSRSADLMFAIVGHHLQYAEEVSHMASWATEVLLDAVRDERAHIVLRATAAMYAAGTAPGWGTNIDPRKGCDAIWDVLHDMGAPASLIAACRLNHKRIRYPLALWVALFHHAARDARLRQHQLQPSPVVDGIPLCALDNFTRVGKQAIREWCQQSPKLARFPLRGVQLAVFYAEGSLVDGEYVWDRSDDLYRLALEAEAASAGLVGDAFADLLEIVRNELPTLNGIRVRLLGAGRDQGQPDLFSAAP